MLTLLQRLLGLLRHTLSAGRETTGGPAFGVVVKILFGRIMIYPQPLSWLHLPTDG